METISQEIYPKHYRALSEIVALIEKESLEPAKSLLHQSLKNLDAIDDLAERIQVKLFLEALCFRLDHASGVQNLYLVPDEGQQIKMFNFMANRFPVVQQAQAIANGIFEQAVEGELSFTLLDIGMGTGQQAENLIRRISENSDTLKEVNLIGIEPSASSLDKAQARLSELNDKYGIAIKFYPINKTAEQLNDSDWEHIRQVIRLAKGKLLLNASFALHHTPPGTFRNIFFQQLKSLDPEMFVIIEPYGDYTAERLTTRFENAWHHYGLTFMAIDTIDEATDDEKSEVKRVFFGREMLDVLSNGNRIEQYETSEMWLAKLKAAGFASQKIDFVLPDKVNPILKVEPVSEDYIGFNVKGRPIVGVICAS